MERLWEELKKIENEAINICSEAKEKSETIIALAKEYAEKLLLDSTKSAEDEARELLNQYLDKARKESEKMLKRNEEMLKELKMKTGNRVNKAIKIIFDAVVGIA